MEAECQSRDILKPLSVSCPSPLRLLGKVSIKPREGVGVLILDVCYFTRVHGSVF